MTIEEIKYLSREGTEKLIQNAKNIVNDTVTEHNISTHSHEDIRSILTYLNVELLKTVRFTEQHLTDIQKSQVRANIGVTGTGADGYSPVRGIDYWTDSDISEIKSYVDEAILGGAW